MTTKTKIVITSGEPAGIGPDICLNLPSIDNAELYIIADPDLLTERASMLAINADIQIHNDTNNLSAYYHGDKLNIIPLTLNSHCQAGVLNPKNSAYVLTMLDLASNLCMQNKVDAMVTGPVQKSIINEAGYNFTGHTEYLADKSNSLPVMMLATNKLRVALATTHLPLKDVSKAITKESLTEILCVLNKFLEQLANIKRPKILVCGLNPHAGEDGNLGDEEILTITPVIKNLKKMGMNLEGPLPADTLFTPKY
ncbi:MAG: 4-hydroxythreonine-4-phosphate dehydrogenase, partial [Gammaproteobacteria bacterium]|nr:4-hydroxythreonine-4-phosphate dehydrogenase [Gammaproteobacteria bacterium]